MADQIEILKTKTNEELIEELLERREEIEALEEELNSIKTAEVISDFEADKHAAIAAQSDWLVNFLMVRGKFSEPFPEDVQFAINLAIDRHVERTVARSVEQDRKEARCDRGR